MKQAGKTQNEIAPSDQDYPGRTNGTIYSNFTAGSWCDVALVEPVAIQ